MWTYLQLVQRLHSESRFAGTGPTDTVGQIGDAARLCNWIADAWFDIQAEHPDLRLLRQTASFTTVDGQATYAPEGGAGTCGIAAAVFGTWCFEADAVKSYLTSAGVNGEIELTRRDYSTWRTLYQLGALQNSKSQPIEYAIGPNDLFCLGPVPLVGYTVKADFYRTPVRLSAKTDVPALPEKHSPMLIVYRALMDYGYHFAAQEALARAKEKYAPMRDRFLADQLPQLVTCGALA